MAHPLAQNGFPSISTFPRLPADQEGRRAGLRHVRIHGILGVLHDGRGGLCGIGEHIKELDFGSLLERNSAPRVGAECTLQQIRGNAAPHEGHLRALHVPQLLPGQVANTFTTTGDLFEASPSASRRTRRGVPAEPAGGVRGVGKTPVGAYCNTPLRASPPKSPSPAELERGTWSAGGDVFPLPGFAGGPGGGAFRTRGAAEQRPYRRTES